MSFVTHLPSLATIPPSCAFLQPPCHHLNRYSSTPSHSNLFSRRRLTTATASPPRRSTRPPRSVAPNKSSSTHTQNTRRNGTQPKTSSGSSSETRRRVVALFTQAKQAERAGDYHNARLLLQQCLALNQRDAHSWLALAQLFARPLPSDSKPGSSVQTFITTQSSDSRESRLACARQTFEQALAHCPNNVHLLHAWAVFEHRSGHRDQARHLFSKALAKDPQNSYVCHAWGLLEQRVGNIKRARELFETGVSKSSHFEVLVAWAVLEGRDGKIGLSRTLFGRAVSAASSSSHNSKAEVYRAWAEIEERVGDLPKARELLSKAITAQPTHPDAHVALAKLEGRRGSTTRAVELVRAAASLNTKPPPSVFNAWAHIESSMCNHLDEARVVLQRGLALHPKDPTLLQSLGSLEEKCGRFEKAVQYYEASVHAKPSAPAFVAWALLEERLRNFTNSERLFEEALATDALHGPSYNAYGLMEARRGNIEEARNVFERGIEGAASSSVYHGYALLELKYGRNVEHARELFMSGTAQTREDTSFVWHSWGMLELGEGEVDNARRVFLNGIKRYPRSSQMLVGAALGFAASGKNVSTDECQARDYFKKAVAADPTHAQAWQTWGIFELRQGRTDAAIALFRRGLRLCPSHGALWQAWAVLETGRGNLSRARQLFQRGADVCPNHVHLLQAWACMEVKAGNVEQARHLLDLALACNADHGPVWNAYGLLEARHGTLARARQNFTTGLSRAPGHVPLYRAFGQTEVCTGNFEHARELFEQGLKINPLHAPLYHAYAKLEAMIGNVSGLARLRELAEKYFGTTGEADLAIGSGQVKTVTVSHQIHGPKLDDDDAIRSYSANTSPMEIALGEVDTCGERGKPEE